MDVLWNLMTFVKSPFPRWDFGLDKTAFIKKATSENRGVKIWYIFRENVNLNANNNDA